MILRIPLRRQRLFIQRAFIWSGLALFLLLGGTIREFVLYWQEAPTGTTRLDYASLSHHSGHNSSGFQKYVNQQVCLKGYIFPTESLDGLTSFLLMPYRNDAPHRDYVAVMLSPPKTTHWTREPVAVSGVLVRTPDDSSYRVPWVLTDCEVRPARSFFDLSGSYYYDDDE
jgi:hypothetical protein